MVLLATCCFGILPAGATDDFLWLGSPPARINDADMSDVHPVPEYPAHVDLALPDLALPNLHFTGTIEATKLSRFSPRMIPAEDLERLKTAAGHYQRGKIADGDVALANINHPVARLGAEWAAVRSGHAGIGFGRIERFLDENADWEAFPALARRAEEAMLSQRVSAPRVLAFFDKRTPTSAAGRAARLLALQQTGQADSAVPLLRALWRDERMGRELESLLLAAFPGTLTARDHRNRMEMYLFKDNAEAALRSASRAGPDHVKLAQARIAVSRKSGAAVAALDAVPPSVRGDTSFLFAQAQHHRRRQDAEGAARLIAPVTRDSTVLVDGDEWWVERRLIARQLLDKDKAADAYTVVASHGAAKPQSIIEAEWHAGWIALRFLNRPDTAARHFEAAARHAETPISLARTAYWRGRAAEAMADNGAAEMHYQAAARHPIAFYGQMARARLGYPDTPLRLEKAAAGNTSRPDHHPAISVLEALDAASLPELARPLILEVGRALNDPEALHHAAGIAHRIGDARLLVGFGKSAVQRGMPLDEAAFPLHGMPAFEAIGHPAEQAMVFAIARQESAFDPKAVSHAGARGLMQMMLPTARETAKRVGLGFEAGRLTSDAAYNARLGAAHLGDLLKDWRGSYLLTFAAYNAGSGNVRDWIEAYGDPRQPGVDPVDWIERIPFSETRNYVQRVMENLQVYRTRLGNSPALLIAQDMRRGMRTMRFAGEIDQSASFEPAQPRDVSP